MRQQDSKVAQEEPQTEENRETAQKHDIVYAEKR